MVSNRVAIIDRGRVLVQDELKALMKFERERYAVEFDACDPLPAWVAVDQNAGGIIQGTIPADTLHAFLAFVQDQGIALYSCSLKRLSLEEIFFDVLKKGGA
jgi:ABC-type multidrug transport system ATPase subunit